jgi:hypothetical protein
VTPSHVSYGAIGFETIINRKWAAPDILLKTCAHEHSISQQLNITERDIAFETGYWKTMLHSKQ